MVNTAHQILELEELDLHEGEAALWWLGQSGYLLRGGGVTLIVDAFLSPGHNRLVPPAFAPNKGSGLDAILCTHDHLDHLDPVTVPGLAAASPEAKIIVPLPSVERVVDLGVARERIIGAQPEEAIEIGGVTIHPVPACHGVDVSDAYNFGEQLSGGLIRYLGFVFAIAGSRRGQAPGSRRGQAHGTVIYHAGDTLLHDGQAETLRRFGVQLALLPINGRDRTREMQNLVGNMDPRDAAQLAADAGCDLLVPMHHDMFPGNLGYPDHLVEYVRDRRLDLAILVPTYSRPFIYTGR